MKEYLTLVAILALSTLFAQAAETKLPVDIAAKAVRQAVQNVSLQKDVNASAQNNTEKKADKRSSDKQ